MNFELCFEGRAKKVVSKEKAKPGGGNSTMKATRPEKRVKEPTLGRGGKRTLTRELLWDAVFLYLQLGKVRNVS